MFKTWIGAALVAGMVGFGGAAAQAAEAWDMPMAYPDGNFHTKLGREFAEMVKTDTNGEVAITVHGGGSLFKGDEIKRAVQRGTAPIGERLISALSNEDPLFALDAIPFLATNYADARKLYAVSKPALEARLEKENLHLLYAIAWPPQGIYANKTIDSAADMRGLKFRTYNATMARLAELLQMVPTQIEAAELSQALATGTVEAMITSGATGVDSQVWEQVKNFYDVQAWLPKNMVFVNKRAWDGLDAKTQEAITKAAAAIEDKGWAMSEELASGYLKTLAENGMTVAKPSAQLAGDMTAIGDKMTAEWEAGAGDTGKAIIADYRAK
ncbi:TRAP transporter substrate-binding protein [Tistrella bauzanensis]|jgi:TRAP-type C4-dicarboxylate transport system substrate-binding protein|uniref:TRAP transporter substrate-binding protein n=1 Tax=Tistrella arctica TaxID=3133430 RepID=A0ABU9YQW0_9PROT